MLYHAYEARRRLTAPVYRMAELQAAALDFLPERLATTAPARATQAVADTVSTLRITHERPAFGIEGAQEEIVRQTPFGKLLRFNKGRAGTRQPRVLVVPGLAGHFATLVRGTVGTLLPHHDVYITDWHNARDVPVSAGRFGLDEYIEHLISYLDALGPGTHLMAVCQPCPAVLAAAALMAQDDHPAQPRSLTLMAGPVDARVNPGPVNEFATKHKVSDLERRAITTVAWPHKGAGRRVYPGFLQVAGFIGMDPRRHAKAIGGVLRDVALGRGEEAKRVRTFYDQYFAVLDVTAEFYLDTARAVFMDHDLARGELRVRDRLVDPGAITSPLLTVEAENDEMCPPGQTEAAHDLCTGIPEERRRHHLQQGVGHYGVFTGSRFEREIYPEIKRFIAAAERADG
jgi:poly(3-hydroxybutyrate) depolymerase